MIDGNSGCSQQLAFTTDWWPLITGHRLKGVHVAQTEETSDSRIQVVL
jgi:hypothetical protein